MFRSPYLSLYFILLAKACFSQTCTGSLGENIFIEGDFGSGPENFLLVDPGIAPGYTYTVNPPPQDGLYSITNSTSRWSNIFPTWLEIEDNSDDPNGYMMVVNASLAPGLFYDQLVEGLCENTLYLFSADIINMIQVGVNDHIQPNVSFLIDNAVAFSSGQIPQDASWHRYGFTFTTAPGQTSVQLSLQNNAPGGFGNDLALDNISFQPCGPEAFILPETIANVCEDGDPISLEATVIGEQYQSPQFQWQLSIDQGLTWSDIDGATDGTYTHADLSSGYYHYRFLLANDLANLDNQRCRVISNEKVVFVQPKFYDRRDTICEGLFVESGGHIYNEVGIYVDSLISSIGCDSIVTLTLNVLSNVTIEAEFDVIDLVCPRQSTAGIRIGDVVGGTAPYHFYIDGDSLGEVTEVNGLSAGVYRLEIIDRYGCSIEQAIEIEPAAELRLDIGPDTTIVMGTQLTILSLTNFPVDSFDWQVSQDFDCDGECAAITYYPFSNQEVLLRAITDAGCVVSDSLNIEVIEDRLVYLPSAFSPNGDQVNDVYNIFGRFPNVSVIRSMAIYDRWGGLLWSDTNVLPNSDQHGWDGTTSAGPATPGVYLVLAEIEFLDGQIKKFGSDLLLMR